MQIEKLNENKIRIILSIEDLKDNNINLHSFMSNSIESQSLFAYILDKANSEVGFNTKDSKLMIEAILAKSEYFIFTITKLNSKNKNLKKLQVQDKTFLQKNSLSICKFNNFDEFCDFCTYINYNSNFDIKELQNSSLYLYDNNYYLVLNCIDFSAKLFKSFCYIVTEFATFINNTQKFEKQLKANGKPIMYNNAIYTCIKYF